MNLRFWSWIAFKVHDPLVAFKIVPAPAACGAPASAAPGAPAPAALGAPAFIRCAATPAALGAPASGSQGAPAFIPPAFIQRAATPAALGAPAPAAFECAATLGDLGAFQRVPVPTTAARGDTLQSAWHTLTKRNL